MILDKLIKDSGFKTTVNAAVQQLETCRAFQVLLELGMRRGKILPSNTPTETAALNAAWMNGYCEALTDLSNLATMTKDTEHITPSFGVIDKLHQLGEITDAEYERHKRSASPNTN